MPCHITPAGVLESEIRRLFGNNPDISKALRQLREEGKYHCCRSQLPLRWAAHSLGCATLAVQHPPQFHQCPPTHPPPGSARHLLLQRKWCGRGRGAGGPPSPTPSPPRGWPAWQRRDARQRLTQQVGAGRGGRGTLGEGQLGGGALHAVHAAGMPALPWRVQVTWIPATLTSWHAARMHAFP